MAGGPSLAVADGFAQLVAHVLAHVPLDAPGNLYDSRYLAWAETAIGAGERAILAQDATILARCWSEDSRLDRLHGYCALHRSLARFRVTAGRELAALEAAEVSAPGLLAQLRELPAAELLHASLALVVDDFEAVLSTLEPELARACEQMSPLLEGLAAHVPGFASARVELVWALGMHGRAFEDRILVGAPAAWSGCSPARQSILAAHEHVVLASERRDHVGREWDALTGLARLMATVDADTDALGLRAAHADWLASLRLTELLAELVERRWLSPALARTLDHEAGARARALAQFEPPAV